MNNEPQTTQHILIVDDNPVNQRVVGDMLIFSGFPIKIAGSASEAFNLLKAEDFGLVLMDVEMDEVDGREATKFIRSGKVKVKNPAIPIIGLSAHSGSDEIQKCLEAGMNGYLSKPIDLVQLREILTKYLPATEPENDRKSIELDPKKELEGIVNFDELLTNVGADLDLARTLLDVFITEAEKQCEAILTAQLKNDCVEIASHARVIGGSAGNVGAASLLEVAAKLDKGISTLSESEINELIIKLKSDISKVREVLNIWSA